MNNIRQAISLKVKKKFIRYFRTLKYHNCRINSCFFKIKQKNINKEILKFLFFIYPFLICLCKILFDFYFDIKVETIEMITKNVKKKFKFTWGS